MAFLLASTDVIPKGGFNNFVSWKVGKWDL